MNPTPESNRVSEHLQAAREKPKEIVAEHPASSALTAFGIGVGAGLAAVLLLSEPSRKSSVTERLGQQLLDAMSSVVPDSVWKR